MEIPGDRFPVAAGRLARLLRFYNEKQVMELYDPA